MSCNIFQNHFSKSILQNKNRKLNYAFLKFKNTFGCWIQNCISFTVSTSSPSSNPISSISSSSSTSAQAPTGPDCSYFFFFFLCPSTTGLLLLLLLDLLLLLLPRSAPSSSSISSSRCRTWLGVFFFLFPSSAMVWCLLLPPLPKHPQTFFFLLCPAPTGHRPSSHRWRWLGVIGDCWISFKMAIIWKKLLGCNEDCDNLEVTRPPVFFKFTENINMLFSKFTL